DLARDPTGFGLAVKQLRVADLLAFGGVRPENFIEALGVVGDHLVGRGQNASGRTVIVFEFDYLRARKIALEIEDDAEIGASEGVNALRLVAYHAETVVSPEIVRLASVKQ